MLPDHHQGFLFFSFFFFQAKKAPLVRKNMRKKLTGNAHETETEKQKVKLLNCALHTCKSFILH